MGEIFFIFVPKSCNSCLVSRLHLGEFLWNFFFKQFPERFSYSHEQKTLISRATIFIFFLKCRWFHLYIRRCYRCKNFLSRISLTNLTIHLPCFEYISCIFQQEVILCIIFIAFVLSIPWYLQWTGIFLLSPMYF